MLAFFYASPQRFNTPFWRCELAFLLKALSFGNRQRKAVRAAPG
jgi:hypothetical protein